MKDTVRSVIHLFEYIPLAAYKYISLYKSLKALHSSLVVTWLTVILCCVIHTSTKSSSVWKSIIFPKRFQQPKGDGLLQAWSPFGGPSLVVFPRLYGGFDIVGCSWEKRGCFWIGLWLVGHQFLSAFICSVWMVLMKDRNAQPLCELHRRSEGTENCAFTCLRKIRWSSLRLGLSGEWHTSRTGERDPSAPKTFSSSKHPVSIIYRRGGEQVQGDFRQRRRRLWTYLVLPGDGNAACGEFGVEIFVRLVQSYSPQCGKLIDVQHVAAVHVPGLHT